MENKTATPPGSPTTMWRVIYPGTNVIIHRDTREAVEQIANHAALQAIPQGYIPGIGWVPTSKIAKTNQNNLEKSIAPFKGP